MNLFHTFQDAPHLGTVSIYKAEILDRKKIPKSERKVKMVSGQNRGLLDALEGSSRATTPMTVGDPNDGTKTPSSITTTRNSSVAGMSIVVPSKRTASSIANGGPGSTAGGSIRFKVAEAGGNKGEEDDDDEDEDDDEFDGDEEAGRVTNRKCVAAGCKLS